MNVWKNIQEETANGSRRGTTNTAINKLNGSAFVHHICHAM